MNPITPAPYERQAEETEEQIVHAARAAIAKIDDCKWTVGRLAHQWTERFAKGRTDEVFAKLVGLSRSQVQQRRQTFESFSDVCHTYGKLTWSHFNVAVNWDDAAEWHAEADKHGWSVAVMQQKRLDADAGNDSVDSESSTATEPNRKNQGQPASTPVVTPDLVPDEPKTKPRKSVAVDVPKRTELERLRDSLENHQRSTIKDLQKDFVAADKLLERHEKSGFDRDAAIELTMQLAGVLLKLQGVVDQCR